MKNVRLFVLIALAFGAGALIARVPERAPAVAATAVAAPLAVSSLDLNALRHSDFSVPNPLLPNLRTKSLAVVDATVVAYSVGSAPKHTHAGTTEIQLIMDGTGSEWLGDRQVRLAPGTFVVVPPNTAHGGFTGGPFKLYTVKTPLQDPHDYHRVP